MKSELSNKCAVIGCQVQAIYQLRCEWSMGVASQSKTFGCTMVDYCEKHVRNAQVYFPSEATQTETQGNVWAYTGDLPLVIVVKWHPDEMGGPAIPEQTIMLTKGQKIDLSIIGLVPATSRPDKSKPEDSRAAGLEKAAEICRYHRDKWDRQTNLVHPAWIAACNEIETSCLATAGRIRRGEYEEPVSDVMRTEFASHTPKETKE